jgi:hypothetical protein
VESIASPTRPWLAVPKPHPTRTCALTIAFDYQYERVHPRLNTMVGRWIIRHVLKQEQLHSEN